MRIVIINRTAETQKIRKSNGDIVAINAYSPYILETTFKPEINFWSNCTDEKFIVTDKISELNKLVASLPKNIVQKQKEMIKESKIEATEKVTTENKDVSVTPVIDTKEIKETTGIDNSNINNTVEDIETVKDETLEILDEAYKEAYKEDLENLNKLSVKNLKILAEKIGVELPNNCRKADMIKLIKDATA